MHLRMQHCRVLPRGEFPTPADADVEQVSANLKGLEPFSRDILYIKQRAINWVQTFARRGLDSEQFALLDEREDRYQFRTKPEFNGHRTVTFHCPGPDDSEADTTHSALRGDLLTFVQSLPVLRLQVLVTKSADFHLGVARRYPLSQDHYLNDHQELQDFFALSDPASLQPIKRSLVESWSMQSVLRIEKQAR